jgi:flagellar hook-associated protein 2
MTSTVSSTTSASATASLISGTTKSTGPLFQAGGLASGLDTNLIIDNLIAAQSAPLNRLKQRQSDYQVQISTLGTLQTQLQALQAASAALSTNGVVAIQPNSTFSDFKVTGSAAAEGSYAIKVTALAKEAKMRSNSFTSAQDDTLVSDGNLQFSIDGKTSVVIDTTGKTLADVAEAINQNVSQVHASVLSTTTGYYLNIARKNTGYATSATEALKVVQDPGLGIVTTQAAQNASVDIDGLTLDRTSNTITDAIPGVSLILTGDSNVSNNVTFTADSSSTEAALNTFVTAYNTVSATLKSQLVTDPTQSYGETLVASTTTSSIQRSMQAMLSTLVVPTGAVRTLADMGLELQQDGTLTLNAITLSKAVSADPEGINAVFSTAKTGIAATIKTLVDAQANGSHSVLASEQTSLKASITEMTDRETSMQSYLDAERTRLVSQFTAMEQLVSGFTNATNYLTQVANLRISSG